MTLVLYAMTGCVALGISLEAHARFGVWLLWFCLGLSMCSVWCALVTKRGVFRRGSGCIAALGFGVALGNGATISFNDSQHIRHRVSRDVVELHLRIVESVSLSAEQVAEILAYRVPHEQSWSITSGRIAIRSDVEFLSGTELLTRTLLRPVERDRNARAWGAEFRAVRRNVGAVIYLDFNDYVVLNTGNASWFMRWRQRLDEIVTKKVLDTHGQVPASIVKAFVLGDKRWMTSTQTQRYARAGLSHLFAVSGFHLSLVSIAIFAVAMGIVRRVSWIVRRVPGAIVAAWASSVGAILYTILTGASSPTVRACVMAILTTIVLSRLRQPSLPRILPAAITTMLIVDPLVLFDPSFQLSCVAMGAILAVGLELQRDSSMKRWRFIYALLGTTVAATASTTAIVSYHFGLISWLGIPANVVAIPLTTFLVLPMSLLGVALDGLIPQLGTGCLTVAAHASIFLDEFCRTIASTPWGAMNWFIEGWTALGWLALSASLLIWRFQRQAIFLGASGVSCLVIGFFSASHDTLSVTFLDVGQGDAAFIQFPTGETMLIDAGSSREPVLDETRFNLSISAGPVSRFLSRRNISTLNWIVATHGHDDHIGGIAELFRRFSVKKFWRCDERDDTPWSHELDQLAHRRGAVVEFPSSQRIGDVTLTLLWPDVDHSKCGRADLSRNENSIVLLVQYGAVTILFTGDIEREAEIAVSRRLRAMNIDPLRTTTILKVPHHGSDTSSSSKFLDAVNPDFAVISSGIANRFGFPKSTTLRHYNDRRIRLFRIDLLGAVTFEISADGDVQFK